MALATKIVWEIRPTVGADTNGGGYKTGASGTDYSQQTSPQYALTGIASAGAGATILYASAAANMVGNVAQVISGTNFTTGFYEIISVSVGVSITFDRSVCTGVGASGVINIGGALATLNIIASVAVGSNTIYVKDTGTLNVSSTLSLSQASGGTSSDTNGSLSFIGYTTTRGDNGKVTWTTSTNSINLITFTGGSGFLFANFTFTTTASIKGACLFITNNGGNTYNTTCNNCVFDGFTYAVSALAYGNTNYFSQLMMRSCEIKNCTTAGIANGNGVSCINCYIHDNAMGIQMVGGGFNATTCLLCRTILYNNSGNGLDVADQPIMVNVISSIIDKNADGIQFHSVSSVGAILFVQNTIIENNTGYGININVNPTSFGFFYQFQNNALRNNTTANYNNATADASDITLTAECFTSASTGDFSLNSTAGGGAACKAAGYNTAP